MARVAYVVLVQAAVFVPIAVLHQLDPDEGWYAYAAERVVHGTLPYRDFFFPQTPLLPYLYGGWLELVGTSWYAARALSVVLAMATGVLVYRYCTARFGPWIALAAVTTYTFTVLVIDWFMVVKTYALSAFLLFGALVLVDRAGRLAPPAAWFAAGLALGLAVDARLLLVAPALAFVLPILVSREPRASKLRSVAWAGAGAALAALPAVFFLVQAPRPFLWDTLRYHALRSPNGFIGNPHQKLQVGESLMALPTGEGASNPQFLLLTVGAAGSAVLLLVLRRRLPLAVVVAVLLALASILPTPSYQQYFSVAVPFLIVAIAEGVALLAGRLRRADPQLWTGVRAAAALVVVAYVMLANVELVRESHQFGRTGIEDTERVSRWIDAHTRRGEEVLSSWPGFLFGTHAVSVPGFENQYGPVTAHTTGPAGARRYKLGSIADLREALHARRTRFVLWRDMTAVRDNPSWLPILEGTPYRLRQRPEHPRVYELTPPRAPGGP